MGKKLIIWGVAMAAFLGFVPGANGQTISVLLFNNSYPEGTTFEPCFGGGNVIAEGRGYNSSGSNVCIERQGINKVWKTRDTLQCSGAVNFRVFLKKSGFDYCTAGPTPWGQPGLCTYNGTGIKAVGYQCGAGTTYAVAKTW
jgi:hypothetical protein